MSKFILLLLAGAFFFAAQSFSRADGQLTNGTFSSPGVVGVQTFYGSLTLTGWTITNGSVDVVNLASQTGFAGDFQSNTQAADLNGFTGYTPAGAAATLYQDVATTSGDLYTFTFGLAANTQGGPAVKTMNILWGDPGSTLSLVNSYTTQSAAFTTYSFTVKADASTSRLELISTTDPTSSWGPYITFAATTVVTAPEPSLLGLLGLGGGLFALARYFGRFFARQR